MQSGRKEERKCRCSLKRQKLEQERLEEEERKRMVMGAQGNARKRRKTLMKRW